MATTDEARSDEALWTEADVAKFLKISPKTLQRWRWCGQGPSFIKVGAAVRYEPAAVRAFRDAGRRAIAQVAAA